MVYESFLKRQANLNGPPPCRGYFQARLRDYLILKVEFNPIASGKPVDRNLLLWATHLAEHARNPLEGAPIEFKSL